MDARTLALMVDLHGAGARQGPGDDEATRLALRLSGLATTMPSSSSLAIADIGCGTGAAALAIAEATGATVRAVDQVPAFLTTLRARAAARGLADRIVTVAASMTALPFDDDAFDVLWSEGAIYSMGFEAGVTAWRRFLKPGGVLAVSELSWFTATRPAALTAHWEREYPEVGTASTKLAVLERCGYAPIGYFPLPERCWLDAYYRPLQGRFADFLARHPDDDVARGLIAEHEAEIALYEQYRDYFGYGFYVARRVG
jgi:SAM-dependent methyltransferase